MDCTDSIFIGFSTTNHLLSRLIRFFTNSKISHVWVKYYDHCLRQWMVMHASFLGVELKLYHKLTASSTIILEKESPIPLQLALSSLVNELGQPYDFRSLFGQIWVQIMRRWFNKKIKNPLRDASKLVCSEFICQLLQRGQIKEVEQWDPETATPEDIFQLCKKWGKKEA